MISILCLSFVWGHATALAENNSTPGPGIPTIETCAEHYRKERYEQALRCFGLLADHFGSSLILLYAQGYAAYQAGLFEKALGFFSTIVEQDPNNGDALFMVGMTELRRKKHKAAQQALKQALAVGLKKEDPEEAKKTLELIKKILEQKKPHRFNLNIRLSGGFDTRPRVSGSAFDARSNTWNAIEETFFFDIQVSFRYSWKHTLKKEKQILSGDADYRFNQVLFYSDFKTVDEPRRMRRDSDPFPLSLQTHQIGSSLKYRHDKLAATLSIQGGLELSGVNPPELFTVYATTSLKGKWDWTSYTSSEISFGVTPRKALNTDYDYLSGHTLQIGGIQHFKLHSRVFLSPAYHYTRRKLGIFQINRRDCPLDDGCLLQSSFSSETHGGTATLTAKPFDRWIIRTQAGLHHTRFINPSRYLSNTGEILLIRRDLLYQHELQFDFRVARSWHIGIAWFFEYNHSNIRPETTGWDENYHRHIIKIQTHYSFLD